MPEIDIRELWRRNTFPRTEELLKRDLYQLVLVFMASQELTSRREGFDDLDLYSYCVGNFEYEEIGRLLLSIAANVRNRWDAELSEFQERIETTKLNESSVGKLIKDQSSSDDAIPLTLIESLHKVIHATTLNLDRKEGLHPSEEHLNPWVYLYGMKSGLQWRATLEIYKWAEAIHAVT